MWVTVLASQPSVSIETETTQRMCSPSRPGLPTVFITSRSSSASVSLSSGGAVARALHHLAAELLDFGLDALKSSSSASPDSSWSLSMSRVFSRASGRPLSS